MSNPLLLLLRLEGPLQSWGTRSRWDVRDSAPEPTKSGIIGLLGCAMGIPSRDRRLQDELDASLMLGVRVESPGLPLVDFHTITGMLPRADGGFKGSPDDPATIISPRTYLQDAAFLAVLGGPEDLIRRCHDAVLDPQWPVYLGRKCCVPTRPIVDELTDRYLGIEDALRRHPWSCQWLGHRNQGPPPSLECTLDDPAGPHQRLDAVRINPARMYGFRTVRTFTIQPPIQEVAPCS